MKLRGRRWWQRQRRNGGKRRRGESHQNIMYRYAIFNKELLLLKWTFANLFLQASKPPQTSGGYDSRVHVFSTMCPACSRPEMRKGFNKHGWGKSTHCHCFLQSVAFWFQFYVIHLLFVGVQALYNKLQNHNPLYMCFSTYLKINPSCFHNYNIISIPNKINNSPISYIATCSEFFNYPPTSYYRLSPHSRIRIAVEDGLLSPMQKQHLAVY